MLSLLKEQLSRPWRYEGGGKGSQPAAPNYAPIAASNEAAANIAAKSATEQLNFQKQVYNDSIPRQNQLYDLASQVAKQQIGSANQSDAFAKAQNDYYNQTYKPIEQTTAMDSMGGQYLSTADQAALQSALSRGDTAAAYALAQKGQTSQIADRNSGLQGVANAQTNALDSATKTARVQTSADAAQAAANNNGAMNRNMMSMGINPNSGKFAAANAGMNMGNTAAQIGALNSINNNDVASRFGIASNLATSQDQAKQSIIANNAAARTGVANFGRNMPNTAAQATATALNAGNSAVANQNTGFNSGATYPQLLNSGYSSQLGAAGIQQQGALGLGGLMNQGYQTAMSGYNANQGFNLGGLMQGGAAMYTAFSDLRLKDNVIWIGTTKKGIPLYEFNYKSEPKQRWRGVIAQEVRKIMPSAVFETPSGYLAVDYAKLGIKMERADA